LEEEESEMLASEEDCEAESMLDEEDESAETGSGAEKEACKDFFLFASEEVLSLSGEVAA
jgi:hypothetical protein